MAPGDLNLKKSWFPKLIKNQAKVWEMEQAALQEHKKIQERQLEFEKEKQKKELIDLQIKNNPHLKNKLISDRIDWMYDDPNKNKETFLDDREKDDYLLGKKKIEIKKGDNGTGSKLLDKHDRLSSALSIGTSSLPGQRDLLKKSKDDPMMKIQQEQIRKLQILKREKILREKQSRESSRIRRPSPDSERRRSAAHRSHRSHDRHHHDKGSRHRDRSPNRDKEHGSHNDRHRVMGHGYRDRDGDYNKR